MAKNNQVIEDTYLCSGVKLGKDFFEKKENRILTLFLKGIIVYLISMGSIGFYMSALDIRYNEFLCHILIFVTAILSAFLYYRLLVENLGYLLLFAVFGMLVFNFRPYINSGFYAIVNITTDAAAQYFNIDIQKLYTEQIEDRYVTITFVCLFIGIVLDVLLNVFISRRMQYFNSLFTVMGLNLIPLYLILEPDMMYVIMLLGGICMAYVLKSSRHYSPQMNVKRNDNIYSEKGKKKQTNKQLSYVYNVKALGQACATTMIVVITVVVIVSAFKPKERFNVGYEGNKYKDLTIAGMTTLLIDGIQGFFNQEEHIGGMQHGQLGNVSSVKLDHETDLKMQITPYSFDTIYLKSFTGVEYVPYANEWVDVRHLYDEGMWQQTPEANELMNGYVEGDPWGAKGTLMLDIIDSSCADTYTTYYSFWDDNWTETNGYFPIEYYPRFSGSDTVMISSDYYEGTPYTQEDLYVPEENKEAVRYVIDQIEWTGNEENYVKLLKEYFQDNIPYTIRPGRTPRKKDFVNYFLLDNKKGYCSHFATAAVLIFREMGIPARYVEGYAVSYNQFENGELVEDTKYSDYYDGYSELGETALIEVNITDADAHAWCEIFITGEGWIPVDVTPAGEEEEVSDFWEMFEETIGSNNEDDGDALDIGIINFKIPNKLIKIVCYVALSIVALIIIFICGRYGVRGVIYLTKYKKATINDKLVMKYAAYCKRLKKKNKDFREYINYREQIEYIASRTDSSFSDKEKVIAILEKAGFSNTAINEQEQQCVLDWISNHSRLLKEAN
ncbi:MAG: transglutaminase domain-containing protein [Lachnospiraceae bacterium]|nr:transglutaminase domain-containing protein [Lachnospiraceae bacterium]